MERYTTGTRKELFVDIDEAGPSRDVEQLAALNSMLRSDLALPSVEKLDDTASKPKKSKKRKAGVAGNQGEPVFEFKLVSGSQPQSISLQEPDVVAVASNRPTREDTVEEEEQRRIRASQIAVDVDWLSKEANATWTSPKPHKQPVGIKVDAKAGEIPTVFLAERQLRPSKPEERPPVGARAMVPTLSMH